MATSGYTYHTIRTLSLPIPSSLAIATTLLPLLTGFSLYSTGTLLPSSKPNSSHSARRQPPASLLIVVLLLTVYETTVATLALTYITPINNLTCALDEHWSHLFRSKDDNAIRRIQETYQCCGLHSTHDKAYPFPKKGVGNDACVKAFPGRIQSCFGPWRGEERAGAGLLLSVAIVVFVIKLVYLSLSIPPTSRKDWLRNLFRHPWTKQNQTSQSYRSITNTEEAEAEDGGNVSYYDDGTVRINRRLQGSTPYSDHLVDRVEVEEGAES
ncbi:MAG: hypothetical protein M1827_004986 [Pycnora praestabilis]|nr:MAG: hypothetical protein M1827_004986 [Pycnora praestabilis]